MARPKLSTEKLNKHFFAVRVNEIQAEKLHKIAEKKGKKVGELLRLWLLKTLDRQKG